MRFEHHDAASPLLQESYTKAKEALSHHALVDWKTDAGILVIESEEVIAGIYFDLTKYPKAVLINAAYVKPEFRRQGIYTRLHKMVNAVAKNNGKTAVYTYIHSKNDLMNEHVAVKIGYQPVMTLYRREVPDEAQR